MKYYKLIKISTIFILLLLSSKIFAIETSNSFKVFYVKGDVYKNAVSVKKGSKIENNDEIIISNGEVTLLTPNENILKIDKSGTYTFSKLVELQNNLETSISSEYFAFIWDNLTKDKEDENNIHGGVYRGNTLMILPLNSTLLVDNEINFSWHKGIKTKNYYFIILNNKKERIITIKSQDTSISILPYYSALNRGIKYYWCATDKNTLTKGTKYYNFEIPTYEWEKQFKINLTEFKKQLTYNNELNALMLIYFYESNYLIMDAYKQYKIALKNFPESIQIKDALVSFQKQHLLY